MQNFKDLGVSITTVMAYSNMIFDIEKMFNGVKCFDIPVEDQFLGKKNKPNLKKISAPYGKIISFRRGPNVKGLDFKKKKRFLNQITCILSMGSKKNINIFIFKSSFKISGCKTEIFAQEIMTVLWDNYLKKIPECYTLMDDSPPNFTFETVMTNMTSINLGIEIDRVSVNNLFNDKKYKDIVRSSKFEPTTDTNVKIKFYSEVPDGYKFTKYTDGDGGWLVEKVDEIKHKTKKKNKPPSTSFLIFRSSKIILSGRYQPNIEPHYLKFLEIFNTNKETFKYKKKVQAKFSLDS